MKKIPVFFFTGLANVALRLNRFIVSYNKVAIPYRYEAQRVENASFIMEYALSAYVIIALLTMALVYFVNNGQN